MSGKGRAIGQTVVNVKIMKLEKRVIIFLVDSDNDKYDCVIGLDLIKKFRLNQNYKLNITQTLSSPLIESNVKKSEINVNNSTIDFTINWNESIPIEKFEAKVSHLDAEKRYVIYNFIEKHSNLFAKNKYDVGTVREHEAHIKLISDTYVSKKPYRCSYHDQVEIETQIRELLNHGMIRESSSPFASPVTMQFKKSGEGAKLEKTRMCVDFRDLNKNIVPESYPFPLIDDLIAKTRNCRWFSAFDINSAFWAIPLRTEDRHKTGFITQQGHYEWSCMPFGLKNSPAVFQRIMSGMIRKYELSEFCTAYIDDLLIHSTTFEQHMNHLESLANAIKKEGFRLKFIKCIFAAPRVQYLGHILSYNSVQPLTDNLIAIKNFPVPKTKKNIRQFLGKVNFYHKFIPKTSTLLEPFHHLLRKDVPFVWSQECEKSFINVKQILLSEPILAVFDRSKPINIYTDASGVGIGAVLKQIQDDGSEKPVAYFSRKLSDAQKKKKAIYIESLAIKEAVKFWKYWLLGRKFNVITDHKPLENLNLRSRTDEELGDLANELLQFDFTVKYRPGYRNSEADCLSRNPVLEFDPEDEEKVILPTVNLLSLENIKESQKKINVNVNDTKVHNVIVRNIKGKKRIVLDHEYGIKLIELVHHRFGHVGPKHILAFIRKYYTFRLISQLTRAYCSKCSICIKNKSRKPKSSGYLGHLGPATAPYQIMSLDTIGGFSNYHSKKQYLHLLVDHFTRYAFILTSKNQTACEMSKLITSVHKENPITTLLTDQHGGLSSQEFEDYCNKQGIHHIFTAVDSAFSNGLNERLNQTIVNRIRCRYNESKNKNSPWSTVAKTCVKEYNQTIHSVTKFAPEYLLYGTYVKLTPENIFDVPNLAQDRLTAFDNSQKYHNVNKARYDRNKSNLPFNIGERVYIENGNKLNRGKLDEIRLGPFPIVRKISDVVFELDVGYKTGAKRYYHTSKMVKLQDSS